MILPHCLVGDLNVGLRLPEHVLRQLEVCSEAGWHNARILRELKASTPTLRDAVTAIRCSTFKNDGNVTVERR